MKRKLEELQAKFRERMKRAKQIAQIDLRDLTDEIRQERSAILDELEKLKTDIEGEKRFSAIERADNPDEYPHTIIHPENRDHSGRGYELRMARDKKDFRSLFGQNPVNEYRWTDEQIGFFNAALSGKYHPDLVTRGMVEGIASDGGFLVPVEYTQWIHDVALENETVMPRANVMPMKSNQLEAPAMAIGDHSSSLYGGFSASYIAEEAAMSANNPKVRDVSLKARKLYGFLKISNELLNDVPDGGNQIVQICGRGLGWYRDKAFLKGTGAGQPLGILNAPCLITVSKEAGQAASTITYRNLCDMMARMYVGSFLNSVWIAHQTTIPQLLTLSITIGAGGQHIPVMTKNSAGYFEILTRPVIFTEKTEALGNKGDILLADFSQYVIGMREEMRLDFSPHLYFAQDSTAARLITRHDGMPIWNEAMTLEDGSTTVSPFVTLEARS